MKKVQNVQTSTSVRIPGVFPSFAQNFQAFAATEKISKIFRTGITRPLPAAANAAQIVKDKTEAAIVKFDEDNERGYGFLVLSLEKVPLLRKKLLQLPIIIANPSSGLHLWTALSNEILNNPDRQVYTAILEQISGYVSGSATIPAAILHLDNLWAMLPNDLTPTDSSKCLQLRHSLPSTYSALVQTATIANAAVSYSSVCSSLQAEYHNQVVLKMKQSTLESDSVSIAKVTAPSKSVVLSDSVANVVIADSPRGRDRSYSRSPTRDSSRDSSRDSYSRDRSRDHSFRKRHRAVNFRGGRRSPSPYYGRRSSHRGRRYSSPHPDRRSQSPGRGHGGGRGGHYNDRSGDSRGRSRDVLGVQCFKCKGWGHYANNCGNSSSSS